MSATEYIETVASWEFYTNPKQYNCFKQIGKLKDAKQVEAFKNRNGCDGRKTEKARQTYDSISFHDCYCNHLARNFDSYIFIHEQYIKGFLPYPGTVLEQPNKVMDIINLISKLKNEQEIKMQKDK
jgi:hypothetical protein